MTQYNSSNVKLSNLQLNKFKSATKNAAEVTLRLSSYMLLNLMVKLISCINYY